MQQAFKCFKAAAADGNPDGAYRAARFVHVRPGASLCRRVLLPQVLLARARRQAQSGKGISAPFVACQRYSLVVLCTKLSLLLVRAGGHARSARDVSYFYLYGRGTQQDLHKAFAFMLKAADAGNRRAQCVVAFFAGLLLCHGASGAQV